MMRQPAPASGQTPRTRPYYIPATCPKCGAALILENVVREPTIEPADIWYDEWVCPRHQLLFVDQPADRRRSLAPVVDRAPGRAIARAQHGRVQASGAARRQTIGEEATMAFLNRMIRESEATTPAGDPGYPTPVSER